MLDRMVGQRDDKHCDDIMRLSTNVKGTYWYVNIVLYVQADERWSVHEAFNLVYCVTY